MRRLLPLTLLTALAALSVTACSPGASDGPVVVVTTNILGDVVQNVVGDRADVTVLMSRTDDPRTYVAPVAYTHLTLPTN